MNLLDLLPEEEHKQAAERLKLDRASVLTLRRELAERPLHRQTQAMYDSVSDWQLPELPDLSAFPEVVLDLETTGLRWWDQDRLIGMGLWTPDGRSRYLPIRHQIGPNHEPDRFFEWCRRELRGKRVVNIRTKFDLHMLRRDHVDLDEQGCTFGDVAHYAALLDDHRRLFNQEDLALAFLAANGILTADECKVKAAHGYDLDPGKFAHYPAGLVAPRAEGDVRTVALLQQTMWPLLTEQSLHRVRELEDSVIPVVVEMEHNGAPIDVPLLNTWVKRAQQDLERALLQIKRQTGVLLETPNKRDDVAKLFSVLGLTLPTDAETGKETLADDYLAQIKHPTITLLRYAAALASLLSKFLLKYQRDSARDGILRYELHQLPYQEDKQNGVKTYGGGGAVSGRFSSAAVSYYDDRGVQVREGINCQQVFGVKSQFSRKRKFNPTQAYIVRKLFIPDRRDNPDAVWAASDMRQIEYRRFVHYSEAERLIASYLKDPLTDYHVMVHGMIVAYTGRDFERTHVKNLNFASLYGAGLLKIALMVGEISEHVYLELKDIQQHQGVRVAHHDPRIAKTRQLYKTYHTMFPEVKRLLGLASELAEKRGYVHTILGRRARFSKGDRFYSALNRVIQGTAAEDNKVAIVDAYRERKRLGLTLRFTVHDELNTDLAHKKLLPQLAAFLNEQRLSCRVPILWDTGAGSNWAEAK